MGYTFSFFRRKWMPWKKCSVMDERLQFVARRRANGGSAGTARALRLSDLHGAGIAVDDRSDQCGVVLAASWKAQRLPTDEPLIWGLIQVPAAESGCLRCANSQQCVHRRRDKCRWR